MHRPIGAVLTATPATDTAGYRPGRGLRLVASEGAAVYDADAVLATFGAGLDGLLGRSLDELSEPAVEAELAVVERAVRRLQARRARATDVLADRQGRRAAEANPDDPVRASERARREVRNDLAERNGWTRSEAKDNERLGKVLNQAPRIAEAADDGVIVPANAVRMGRFLERLGPDERAAVEPRLLEAAAAQDPVTFGRTVDAVRAELSPDDAEKAEARRHANRRASVKETADGMTRIYGELATVDGAIVSRAIDTYRRLDGPGEHRRPEQRTADALVEVARAALRAEGTDASGSGIDGSSSVGDGSHRDGSDRDGGGRGGPSRNHGTRPHVVVTIPIDVLLAGAGMVELDGTAVPLGAVRHLLDDAGWAFVVTETNTTPIAVTGESRTVSAALWRALVLRDAGCIVEGCDMKADWCEVMHLEVAHRDGGRLTLDNAGLGCKTHHRAYDGTDRLELHWTDDGKPILRPRGRSPDSRAGPGP